MAWYFPSDRAGRRGGGRVATAYNRFDTHAELRHAVDHLRALARAARPAELFLHRLDGNVKRIGVV